MALLLRTKGVVSGRIKAIMSIHYYSPPDFCRIFRSCFFATLHSFRLSDGIFDTSQQTTSATSTSTRHNGPLLSSSSSSGTDGTDDGSLDLDGQADGNVEGSSDLDGTEDGHVSDACDEISIRILRFRTNNWHYMYSYLFPAFFSSQDYPIDHSDNGVLLLDISSRLYDKRSQRGAEL